MPFCCLFETPLTWIALVGDEDSPRHILMLEGPRAAARESLRRAFPDAREQKDFARPIQLQLTAYLAGERTTLDAPLDLRGLTPFQQQVLTACRRIPPGATVTYAELARKVGRPRAARAVGNALAKNPLPLLIPCHRVVAGNRRLGGFSAQAGVALKKRLLALERATL